MPCDDGFLNRHELADFLCPSLSMSIFNGDATITSAVLDRLLHHAETVVIEGSSFRMKDRIET